MNEKLAKKIMICEVLELLNITDENPLFDSCYSILNEALELELEKVKIDQIMKNFAIF
jgi:hypothetical protein